MAEVVTTTAATTTIITISKRTRTFTESSFGPASWPHFAELCWRKPFRRWNRPAPKACLFEKSWTWFRPKSTCLVSDWPFRARRRNSSSSNWTSKGYPITTRLASFTAKLASRPKRKCTTMKKAARHLTTFWIWSASESVCVALKSTKRVWTTKWTRRDCIRCTLNIKIESSCSTSRPCCRSRLTIGNSYCANGTLATTSSRSSSKNREPCLSRPRTSGRNSSTSSLSSAFCIRAQTTPNTRWPSVVPRRCPSSGRPSRLAPLSPNRRPLLISYWPKSSTRNTPLIARKSSPPWPPAPVKNISR